MRSMEGGGCRKRRCPLEWWQLWIGLTGLVLGAITMCAAIAAALYAKRAAIATEATVSIAQHSVAGADEALKTAAQNANAAMRAVAEAAKANEIAAGASQRQLRPYVYSTEHAVTFLRAENGLGELMGGEANLHFQNFGQTPAKDVSGFAIITIGKDIVAENIRAHPSVNHFRLSDIPPGRSKFIKLDRTDLRGKQEDITNARLSVYVVGRIEYKDSNQTNYFTDFSYWFSGREFSTMQPVVNHIGNAAT
jgi:hypothetical protein